VIATVAGNDSWGYGGDGGLATNAWLANPQGVAVDGAGYLYIADTSNNRIRKVDGSGLINTIVGMPIVGGNGTAKATLLFNPRAVAIGETGNIYIAESDKKLLFVTKGRK